jgi:hypothetical protein
LISRINPASPTRQRATYISPKCQNEGRLAESINAYQPETLTRDRLAGSIGSSAKESKADFAKPVQSSYFRYNPHNCYDRHWLSLRSVGGYDVGEVRRL